jgi:hypothetical protein
MSAQPLQPPTLILARHPPHATKKTAKSAHAPGTATHPASLPYPASTRESGAVRCGFRELKRSPEDDVLPVSNERRAFGNPPQVAI